MTKYCLDSNALIEPWNKYYSMRLCPDYWDVLDELAKDEIIFCPEEVRLELLKIDDALGEWAKCRPYLFHEITREVQLILRDLLNKYPRLVDTIKDRSMADPWVIAHAVVEKAVVVTKEPYSGSSKTRIRIPDVCAELGVPCIDDHQFVDALGLRFSLKRGKQD